MSGGSRMPNGKIGKSQVLFLNIMFLKHPYTGASQWGFGMQSAAPGGGASGAPGLPNPQGRGGPGASSSFAQTIGSSQNSTALDPSYVL